MSTATPIRPAAGVWAPAPGFPGYEVERDTGAVRSWHATGGGARASFRASFRAAAEPRPIARRWAPSGEPRVTLVGAGGRPANVAAADLYRAAWPGEPTPDGLLCPAADEEEPDDEPEPDEATARRYARRGRAIRRLARRDNRRATDAARPAAPAFRGQASEDWEDVAGDPVIRLEPGAACRLMLDEARSLGWIPGGGA